MVNGSWYARPVFAVREASRALDFYIAKLGFSEDWRYEEEARLRIVQVSRQGCELILSDQWPQDAGAGRLFVSLDAPAFQALTQELATRGAEARSDWWGYTILAVDDLDGNRLWFPHPAG